MLHQTNEKCIQIANWFVNRVRNCRYRRLHDTWMSEQKIRVSKNIVSNFLHCRCNIDYNFSYHRLIPKWIFTFIARNIEIPTRWIAAEGQNHRIKGVKVNLHVGQYRAYCELSSHRRTWRYKGDIEQLIKIEMKKIWYI